MKDFMLRNDTKLLFRNDPTADLAELTAGKKVLFVYGGGSIKKNGCYDDVKKAVENRGGVLYEHGNASRELEKIKQGIQLVKEQEIDLIIGAGGASIMDCAKLIAFGAFHTDDLWDYVKGEKNPYGQAKLPLILMPTYPSSGSEYGLGAVSADSRTGEFGTAYGIAADTAILVPKYSMSLDAEMTAYTALVTLVQLSASTIGDKNTEVLVIPSEIYKSIMEVSAPLANYTNEIMASRFSDVMWLIDQVMWKSFDKRLADFLLNEMSIEGTSTLKITHETIGNHLGNPREVITRMLKYFVNEGLISLSRGTIEIIDKDGLEKIID